MQKDLILLGIGRLFQVIILIVSLRVLTTVFTPEELGEYYIILALVSFFNLVLLNPPGMYFGRNLIKWQESGVLTEALIVLCIWVCLVSIISPVFLYLFFKYYGNDPGFELVHIIALIFMSILISAIHRNALYGINTLGYRKDFVIYHVITLLIGLIISIYITEFHLTSAIGWLFGIVIAEIITLPFILKIFIDKYNPSINQLKKVWTKKKILSIAIFCIPILVTTSLLWGQSQAYRLIVNFKYGAETLGSIALGMSVASAIFTSIEAICLQFFNPIFLKGIHAADKNTRTTIWNQIASIVAPIYLLTTFFVIFLSEKIVFILLDQGFHHVYTYTAIGAAIELFRVITNLLNNVAQSEMKTYRTITPFMLGVLLLLLILWFFDFTDTNYLIASTILFSYFIICILMFFSMRKLLLISIKFNIKQCFIFAAPMACSLFFTPNSYFSSLFVLVIFGLLYLYACYYFIRKSSSIVG